MSRFDAIKTGFVLYWHALPYAMLYFAVGIVFIFGLLRFPSTHENSLIPHFLYFFVRHIIICILAGISAGIMVGIVISITKNINLIVTTAAAFSILTTLFTANLIIGLEIFQASSFEIPVIIAIALSFGALFGITYSIGDAVAAKRKETILLGTLFAIIGVLSSFAFSSLAVKIKVILFSISMGTAFGIAFARAYYFPLHLALIWPEPRMSCVQLHPALWDDLCGVPYIGLHRMLIQYAEESRWRGKYEIERIIKHYPAQRNEALKAKTALLARRMGTQRELSQLDRLAARLPEGEKGFLSQTPQVREWIEEISRLQMRLDTINRPSFREPTAELLCEKIRSFRDRIAGYHEPLNSEFRAAATKWLQIAERQLTEAKQVTKKQLTEQVFRAGDPVDRDQEAFAPRESIVGELEQQVMMSKGCPGIVLYGRRRMGKSTILHNLEGFLPPDVRTAFVSMQNPNLFASLESALHSLAGAMHKHLPTMKPDATTDLRGFYDYLSRCDEELKKDGKRLLLAVDEYESIDKKIGEGVFPLDLLDTIRESIQTHRRITWIFSGSHEITELTNAPWPSYLVSARTIEVPSFIPAETRMLLTEPLKHSSLWQKDDPKRPRFDAGFWGEGGIERIHAEAAGWPHLVQLLAEVLVDLVNDDKTDRITASLMDRAFDKATERGHNVLYELMHGESKLAGEWEYLSEFRRVDEQLPPVDEKIAFSLRRRKLIEEANGQWRLRVPLMSRWLKIRG